MMNAFWMDLRFSLRLFRKSPRFYGLLAVMLSVGIGAVTAMWSIVDSVLLAPLPYDHAERITRISTSEALANVPSTNSSLGNYFDWKAQAKSFENMAVVFTVGGNLAAKGSSPEPLRLSKASGEFFSVFGARAEAGRLFDASDDKVGGAPVIVLGDELFQRRFHGDRNLVGQSILINAQQVTVIGVAPPGFAFGSANTGVADAWMPVAASLSGYKEALSDDARGAGFFEVVGRRRAGLSLEVAQAELSTIAKGLEHDHPEGNAGVGVLLEDLHAALTGEVRGKIWTLLVAVAFVFAILCANLTNLLLTTGQARRGEMSVRGALGATSGRLALQSLTEMLCLFLVGILGGALSAPLFVRSFGHGLMGDDALGLIHVSVSPRALLTSSLLCLLSGGLAALAPALFLANVSPQEVLKASAARAGTNPVQARTRAVLVVGQIAVTCALLIATGLALRSFSALMTTHPGFESEGVGYADINLPMARYPEADDVRGIVGRLMARLADEPSISELAVSSLPPMGGASIDDTLLLEGEPKPEPGKALRVSANQVTPGYFRTMGIPLLKGRDFTRTDDEHGARVIILSKFAVDSLFHGADPLGRRIVCGARPCEVVGVVGDVRPYSLSSKPKAAYYLPFAQFVENKIKVVIRSPHIATALEKLPAIVEEIDPDQAVSNRKPLADLVAMSVAPERTLAFLLSGFAAAALVISTLGVFGLVSFTTSQRTREIGIRMALGATPTSVVALVMKGGLRLVLLGLLIGVGTALLFATLLRDRTGGAFTFDVLIYVSVPALLSAIAAAASLLPARHAVRIAPSSALRYE